jgi:hypothetical protein
VVGRNLSGGSPFGRALDLWVDFAAGETADGTTVPGLKPAALVTAEPVVALAERFHVLPSQVLQEPVASLRMVRIVDRVRARRAANE